MRVLLSLALLLAGCGSTTDRQTRTIETTRTTTTPIIFDIPMVGQAVIHPAQVTVQRTQQEVETTTKTIDMPDVGGMVMQAAGGTPWGGIIASVVGLGAAFVGKKAVDNGRQRDNLIDSMEAAKRNMDPETWEKVKTTMNDVQHDDTIEAIKKRTT